MIDKIKIGYTQKICNMSGGGEVVHSSCLNEIEFRAHLGDDQPRIDTDDPEALDNLIDALVKFRESLNYD